MKREQRAAVIEFASKVSDDELRFVALRLAEKHPGDLPEALDYLSKKSDMDNILSSAGTAADVFDLCDGIKDVLLREMKKRKILVYPEPDNEYLFRRV